MDRSREWCWKRVGEWGGDGVAGMGFSGWEFEWYWYLKGWEVRVERDREREGYSMGYRGMRWGGSVV
jgi:hypothetical protein